MVRRAYSNLVVPPQVKGGNESQVENHRADVAEGKDVTEEDSLLVGDEPPCEH